VARGRPSGGALAAAHFPGRRHAAGDGAPLLEQAGRTATTAAGLVTSDPYSAYVLAYDAARFTCIALLAQQGLRATTSGGHYAVEQAVRAQFGDGFRPFGILRRRRNELEYPHLPADTASAEEAEQAAKTAQRLITAAGTLLPQLSFFSQDQQLWVCSLRRRLRVFGGSPAAARRVFSSCRVFQAVRIRWLRTMSRQVTVSMRGARTAVSALAMRRTPAVSLRSPALRRR